MTEEPRTINEPIKHKRWANSVEGLFTAISYVFGIGNVLIFPYYCGIHGGAAFLFPVAIVYIFVGFPITYIELSLGQFASISPHRIFKKLSLPFTG
uniref:Uncharacterized protein n=1 Tax=Acrobeloides nanus TaxID=290746 RepID=A0A914DX32_9BILA